MKWDKNDLSSLTDYWEGDWAIQRSIPEHSATLIGVARFQKSGREACRPILDYCENGVLTLNKTSETFQAMRRYSFECFSNNVVLFFADGLNIGKVFQNLTPANNPSSADKQVLIGNHLCVKDNYGTVYEIADDDHFIVTHHVNGPAKNYTSTTLYFRSPLTA
ncbi:MAG: DUF6314 family protein [Alphaproteobacteria bacterium]